MNIGKDILKGLEDVGKGLEWPFKHLAQFIAVIGVALKDEPELQTAVMGLLEQFKPLLADGAADFASNGLNLPADLKTLANLQTLMKYFTDTFLPTVEQVWKDAETVVDTAAAPVPAAPAAAEVKAGPGLHAVVPA